MPILKTRTKSLELVMMSMLKARMEFNPEVEQQYQSLLKGFEGEIFFDTFFEACPENWLVLNDLWLKNDNSTFQIDSLLITPRTHYIFDVKNYQDEYYIRDGRWYFLKSNKETKSNPITQLQRCETSYRYLLRNLGTTAPVVSTLVFVNPEFTLYEAPRDLPMLMPTQIPSFFRKLKKVDANISTPPSPTQSQLKIASQLASIHLDQSPYSNLQEYSFDVLKKGILCKECQAFLPPPVKRKEIVICHHCGKKESVKSAILRNIEEFMLLFPGEKVTTGKMYEWCRIIECRRRLSRVLVDNYQRVSFGRATYYVNKY